MTCWPCCHGVQPALLQWLWVHPLPMATVVIFTRRNLQGTVVFWRRMDRNYLTHQSKTSSQTYPCMPPLRGLMKCSLILLEPRRAELGLIPTISSPRWSMQSKPTMQAAFQAGSKGPSLKVVPCFTLDTVLALSESLPCPGVDGMPSLG